MFFVFVFRGVSQCWCFCCVVVDPRVRCWNQGHSFVLTACCFGVFVVLRRFSSSLLVLQGCLIWRLNLPWYLQPIAPPADTHGLFLSVLCFSLLGWDLERQLISISNWLRCCGHNVKVIRKPFQWFFYKVIGGLGGMMMGWCVRCLGRLWPEILRADVYMHLMWFPVRTSYKLYMRFLTLQINYIMAHCKSFL